MEHTSVDDEETVEAEPGVFPTQLVAGEQMNAQHFAFDPGASASEHSHPAEQVAFVYEGTLTLLIDGEAHDLEAGDSFLVPGGVPHAAANRGDEPARGIDVFSPPRDGTPWDE